MSKRSVFCIAENESKALDIVNCLKSGGFSNDEISILFPEMSPTKGFINERHTPALEILIAIGIPNEEAQRYQEKIKVGYTLISVHPDDNDGVVRAKHILEICGSRDIAVTGEVTPQRSEKRSFAGAPG